MITLNRIEYLCSILIFDGLGKVMEVKSGQDIGTQIGIDIYHDKVGDAYTSGKYLKNPVSKVGIWGWVVRIGAVIGWCIGIWGGIDRFQAKIVGNKLDKATIEILQLKRLHKKDSAKFE